MRALTLLAMPNGPAQLAGAALSQAAQYLERVSRQSVTVKVLGQEYLQDLGDRQLRRWAGVGAHEGISGDLMSSKPSGL